MNNTKRRAAIVEERCPRCQFGFFRHADVICNHPMHPGVVNVIGAEWAASCTKFIDTGKVGREVRKIVRG